MSGSGASPMAAQLAAQEMRTKVQQATETVLKRNLSLDEFNAYSSRRDQAASSKRVSVYNGEGEVYVVKAQPAKKKAVKAPGQ